MVLATYRRRKSEFKKVGCGLLETVIMEVFAKFGWRFRNRIVN